MPAPLNTVCPQCGQWVKITTTTIATGRNQAAGRARMIAAHEDPDWPGQLCPGAYTAPIRNRKQT